ncbi:cation transporter [Spirilliplanes yamanashiensis]|nr:heavy metal-associated domain-containing protein [Spirilliplanes yamanashiensis]MDP9818420.1 copper chaperone CopZ [Spirilliplanes yamanashiensis]
MFVVDGMHCASCGMLIDDTLEDLAGVRSAQTAVRRRILTVRLDPAVITPDDVVSAVVELGYTARPASH